MVRWLIGIAVTGALIGGLVFWYYTVPPQGATAKNNPKGLDDNSDDPQDPSRTVDIGTRLVNTSNREVDVAAFVPSAKHNEMVIPGHLVVGEAEEVPSQRDGKILFIAGELPTDRDWPAYIKTLPVGEQKRYFRETVTFVVRKLRPGENPPRAELREVDLGDSKAPEFWCIAKETDHFLPKGVVAARELRWFRELRVGDIVRKGQLLAVVDPSLAVAELESRVTKFDAKEATRMAAEKTRNEALERKNTLDKLKSAGTRIVPDEEYRGAILTYERYFYEEIEKTGDLKVAERELQQAMTVLRQHEIRSDYDAVIRTLYKKKGEAIRNLEAVLQVQNREDLRVEGTMEVQNLPFLQVAKETGPGQPPVRGTMVVIEPTVQQRHKQVFPGHLGEVTAVAVSNHDDDPRIVSASEDGTVRVWNRSWRTDPDKPSGPQQHKFAHPVAVKAVACTPPGYSDHLCLSGSVDGIGRIWNLDRDDDQKPVLLTNQHRGPINCVAFSPDGKFCATGGEDRNICLWETQGGKCVYTFPQGHKGGVTSIQFTRDMKLVSAGRDYQLLIWMLGDKSARVDDLHFRDRGGEVTTLGVSPDGQHTIFDRERQLRLLSLKNGQTEAVLENPVGSANFSSMAVFSPDGKLVLASSGAEGKLQLWLLPTEDSRAYELRQLVWSRSATTCAAFSAYTKPEDGFIVTGTKEGSVVVWALPGEKEINERIYGEIVLAEPLLDTSIRQVRVWARIVQNPGPPLIAGNTANMVRYFGDDNNKKDARPGE